MNPPPARRIVTTRLVRSGQPEPPDLEWLDRTPEERIEAVGMLTQLCLSWAKEEGSDPRLQKLLSAFNAHGVDHIIVGAHALAAHGHVRATKDLDVWVRPERENARRVLSALAAFGAPVLDLTERDLAEPGLVFQIGVAPMRIDVITAIDGVVFAEAWRDRVQTRFGGEPTAVLSLSHLIANKRASGRLQDLADRERLEQIAREQSEL